MCRASWAVATARAGIVQVFLANQRHIAGQLGSLALVLGERDLRLQELDGRSVAAVLDVLSDQPAARGQIIRQELGCQTVAAQRASAVASALEHLGRSHFQVGLGLRSGCLVAQGVDRVDRTLRVAHHGPQRRQRIERGCVARSELEHALISCERPIRLLQILG